MIPSPCESRFRRASLSFRLPLVAVFFLVIWTANAGTWAAKKWVDDADLPQPKAGKVTHAVAFGTDAEPAVPSPFQTTKSITGKNWQAYLYPELTASVRVVRNSEQYLSALDIQGKGALLLRGQLGPTETTGGVALEISGLKPGARYNLVLFGLGYSVFPMMGDLPTKVGASDVLGKTEVLNLRGKGLRYWVYDYTAPSNGQLVVSFEADEANPEARRPRFSAFLNYKVD